MLDFKSPGLHVGRSIPIFDRPADALADGSEKTLGTAGRQLRPGAWKWVRDTSIGCRAVALIGGQNVGRVIEPLEPAASGSRRAALNRFKEDTVAGANHSLFNDAVSEADAGAKVPGIGVIWVWIAGGDEAQSTIESGEPRNLKGIDRAR